MELPHISSIYQSASIPSAGDANSQRLGDSSQGYYPPLTPIQPQHASQSYSSSYYSTGSSSAYSDSPPMHAASPRPAPSGTLRREFHAFYESQPSSIWTVNEDRAENQPCIEVREKGVTMGNGKGRAKDKDLSEDKDGKENKDRNRWTKDDQRLLLGYFSENPGNYERFKLNSNATAQNIAETVFNGQRSASAIRNQWAKMKNRYTAALQRLRSTGEGQREDEDKWQSIKLGWLEKACPLFEEIEDVLKRDTSVTSNYLEENGPAESHIFKSGVHFINGDDDAAEEDEQYGTGRVEDADDEEEESLHPPTGGAKNPLKRGQSSGRSIDVGTKDTKRLKKSATEKAVENFEQKHLMLEEYRIAYTKERDIADRELREKIYDQRHQQAMMKMDMQAKRYEMETKRFEMLMMMLRRDLGSKNKNRPKITREEITDENVGLNSDSQDDVVEVDFDTED